MPSSARQAIELPSWAFGNSGTRFKVFAQPGVPARPVREDRRRRAGAPVHRARAVGRAAHPVGPRRRLRQAAPPRRRPRRPARHDQHEHVPGRRLQAREPVPRRRARARQGDRAHARVRRHHGRHRQPRPEGLAARRTELSRARPTCATGRSDSPTRWRRSTPASATHQRLVLEYKFFEPAFYATDVPDWGTAYVHCVALGERAVVCLDTGHHAPGTNIEFIVMQLLRLGRLGRVRLQLALLRRRRPDRRRGRSVPAVPHPVRGRARRRLRRATATSRSCSTSATTSKRRSPARSARC